MKFHFIREASGWSFESGACIDAARVPECGRCGAIGFSYGYFAFVITSPTTPLTQVPFFSQGDGLNRPMRSPLPVNRRYPPHIRGCRN